MILRVACTLAGLKAEELLFQRIRRNKITSFFP